MGEFPFVGAGEAQYFEWADVFVRFTREPDKAKRTAIEEGVPPPLRDTIEWDGPLLFVASSQGVSRTIRSAYGKGAKARFNLHIEEWLRAAHAKVPILVAYRREDLDVGATKLSDWHTRSLAEVERVVAAMAQAPVPGDQPIAKRLIAWANREIPLPAALTPKAAGDPLSATTETKGTLTDGASIAKALARALPKFAKRLAKTTAPVAVRKGATPEAIDALSKRLRITIKGPHRALLRAFDGGTIGEIVFLGTDAIEGFSRAHFASTEPGVPPDSVVVARTGRHRLIAIPAGETDGGWILEGDGGDGHRIERTCQKLDVALDHALKAKRV